MKRILVPTDASPLSARAIPLAANLARAQAAAVNLVQVVQYPIWQNVGAEGYVDANLYQQVIDLLDEDAQRNLDAAAGAFREAGVPAETALFHGSPAAALLDYETQTRPDLVVMATHGRTGLVRFARGSVADAMVRDGTAPVLLIRAFGSETTTLEEALVPLDGSRLAEEALEIVEELAQKPLKSIRLLRAVAAHREQAAAERYLERVAHRIAELGLAVQSDVWVGEPADVIQSSALATDFVIMATHGRGGFDRMRHGSVADRSLHDLPLPVLLVRAGLPIARREEAPLKATAGIG